jgi:hypothetical protein
LIARCHEINFSFPFVAGLGERDFFGNTNFMQKKVSSKPADKVLQVEAVEALAATPLSERLVGSSQLLCKAGWSWESVSDRADEMRIAGTSDNWLLLLCYIEEISGDRERRVIAAVPKEGSTAREAARAALRAFWNIEKSAVELTRPNVIVAGKVLTEHELFLIADEVWPDDD